MKLTKNSKLVMIGDSITDTGRAQPIGEAPAGLGSGYVSLVNALLGAVNPELRIRVINTGTGGNTVRELKGRWQRDVIDLKPDWLSVMIGINDVWRRFDRPLHSEIHVDEAQYERTLTDLVEQVRPSLTGLVLMTPFFLEPNRDDPMRKMMDVYGEIVARIAREHDAIFVDTQAAFDSNLEFCHPAYLAGDRVHPNLTGHMILARSFLNALDFEWK